jgi:chaperonin GroEL
MAAEITYSGQSRPAILRLVNQLADEPNFGFNAARETYQDLAIAGVFDPARVIRMALENAASIGSLMLTTEAVDRGLQVRSGRL